jgi:hypothetical protein
MPARWFRETPAQVHVVGSSVIEDLGTLVNAHYASGGWFLFSEVGAGVRPLVLLGTIWEIRTCLRKWGKGIKNIIEELPEIYMGVDLYKPGERFKGLFPKQAAILALTKGITGIGIGGLTSEVVGLGAGISDIVGFAKSQSGVDWYSYMGGGRKARSRLKKAGLIYVKFHYLRWKGARLIGKRKVSSQQLLIEFDKRVSIH